VKSTELRYRQFFFLIFVSFIFGFDFSPSPSVIGRCWSQLSPRIPPVGFAFLFGWVWFFVRYFSFSFFFRAAQVAAEMFLAGGGWFIDGRSG